jgi:hypothetical protein
LAQLTTVLEGQNLVAGVQDAIIGMQPGGRRSWLKMVVRPL